MANRYFISGGINNNWNTSGNWSASSGGAGGAGVPTTGDAVFLDINSPACTLDVNAVGASISTVGYAYTLSLVTFNLTIEGNGTFTAGTISGGSGTLTLNNTNSGTTTFDGCTFTRGTSTVYCKRTTTFVGGGTTNYATRGFYNIQIGYPGITCNLSSTGNAGFGWYNVFTLYAGTFVIGTNTTNTRMTWVGKTSSTPMVITAGATFSKTTQFLWLTFAPQAITANTTFNLPTLSDSNYTFRFQIEGTSASYYVRGTQAGDISAGYIYLDSTVGKAYWMTNGYGLTQRLYATAIEGAGSNAYLDCTKQGATASVVNVTGTVLGLALLAFADSAWTTTSAITSTTYTVNLGSLTINNGSTAVIINLGSDETPGPIGFNTVALDATSTGIVTFSYRFCTQDLLLNPGNSVKYGQGQTFAVINRPTWTGTGANKITLRSSTNGSTWYINDTTYNAVIESGSQADTITETGSATDTITETGDV